MRQRRPVYVRQWRKHRGLTLEALAERLHMHKAALSRIERGERPYTQDFLEACADALMCDPVDLLIRDPTDPEGIWSIWDHAQPGERQQIVRVARAMVGDRKNGTDG